MTGRRTQTQEAVRWLVEEKGLSDQEVAQRLNITVGYVSDIMRPIRKANTGPRHIVRLRETAPNDVAGRIVNREPCFACGVRRDVHDTMGCKRWRAL